MALDKRNYRQLVDTTVEIANKVGTLFILFAQIKMPTYANRLYVRIMGVQKVSVLFLTVAVDQSP
ncbi:hypothetical protein BpHYR1_030635 [Brachionus plicatilis]|uniref:Uncharacterized protein n=1 Tax=Brachionus plicatilis TaxID=10195 RepID=A0A3M7RD92_BRAPC|nr:hypothetical protein BpHYR1_030635 [Brachionus plicatilis]